MKERPILYNAEMVNAVLEDRKWKTRRVINWKRLQKKAGLNFPAKCRLAWFTIINNWGIDAGDGVMREVDCPYGRVGDQLWVRETFWQKGRYQEPYPGAEQDEYKWIWTHGDEIKYAATDVLPGMGEDYHKRPSIFMFRKDSRIQLEITGVRVERVQDISEEDAIAEGCKNDVEIEYQPTGEPIDYTGLYAGERFENLWDSINGKPRKDGTDISWSANPWVWVVEFKKI